MTNIGLRIDVDTLRGTRKGVPALEKLLFRYGIQATFFFSLGPDNMGRSLWRLAKPAFLKKMLRSKAASLYGWDILFRGTLMPGPLIGRLCETAIRRIAARGHGIGVHAWDHYTWQTRILSASERIVCRVLQKGFDELVRITGEIPTCSAAPGWIVNDTILCAKDRFPFAFNSDCRGESVFYPMVNGQVLRTPQVPVTLPTYDELIGRDGVTPANYNDRLLALLKPGKLNVLTIHAEVEGIACLSMFEDFIKRATAAGCAFVPLSECLRECPTPGVSTVFPEFFPGRDGRVGVQQPPVEVTPV